MGLALSRDDIAQFWGIAYEEFEKNEILFEENNNSFHFWQYIDFYSKDGDFPVNLIIRNQTDLEIHIDWLDYNANRRNNG